MAVDVQNPLLGPAGCSRIYGPQKGLTEFETAERCLGRLAEVLENTCAATHAAHPTQGTHATQPGAGAAGGLGFGLLSFADARLAGGFELFKEYSHLAERVKAAQLVITGEGAIDTQTLMGKGVGEIARLCRELGVPCLALAGVVEEPQRALEKFQGAFAITPDLTDRESACRDPAFWLEQLAARVADGWSNRPPSAAQVVA